MKKRIRIEVLFFLIFILLGESLFAISAKEIIRKSEDAVRGRTQIIVFEIKIKTRRWERTLKMTSWEDRFKKKSFSEITAPRKDAGNRFLLLNKNMRHYIPKLQKVVKISPSMMLQSWMGSDFSNDDIVKESSIIEDYNHLIDGKKNIDGFECYRVILKPKPNAPVVWGKIIYYARVKDYLPVKKEFFNEHNVLKKYMTFKNFRKIGGRVIPTVYKMQTVKKKNRYTEMVIKKAKFNVRISKRKFTLQNLKRR